MMNGISSENNIGALAGAQSAQAASETAAKQTGDATQGTAFAELFAQMMQEQTMSMLSGGSEDSDSLCFPGGGGLLSSGMSAVMNAMSSGGAGEQETALYLLFLMMSSNSEFDSAQMMPLISAMTGRTGTGAVSAASARAQAPQSAAIGTAAPELKQSVLGGSGKVAPDCPWVAANPRITGAEGQRSAERLKAIIGQFDVEESKRYQPYQYGSDTYCNIFVWDVTSALGAEIPHYVDAATGAPKRYPEVSGARELNANGINNWLTTRGREYGWTEVDGRTAQEYANRGCPAVTSWKNPSGGSGHVQAVCPSKDGGYDELRGVTVAQAGRNNKEYAYLSSTFSCAKLPSVKYFVHN